VSSSFPTLNGAEKSAVESEMTPQEHGAHVSDSPRKDGIVSHNARGFSLLETMVVVSITLIAACISFITLQPTLKQAHANAAFSESFMLLRQYRQRAIDERKRYIVTFVAPQTIQISRWDVAVPVSPAPVLLYTETISPDVQFTVVAGVPGGAPPDNFGNAAAAIDFGQGIGLGGLNYVLFMPDGSAQDVNGNLNNGVLYMGRPGDLYSSRAVSVFGATGRIRGWQLVQQAGAPTWVQR
jgi:prepilin-type N-terminal cleavage/methylation domain-containing protein